MERGMPMVTIRDDAASLLTHIQSSNESDATLRVVMADGELVIGQTEAARDDEVCFYNGTAVLRLAADAAVALAGFTFTTEKTTEGTTLAIIPAEEAETN
jgi:hypothetical protein